MILTSRMHDMSRCTFVLRQIRRNAQHVTGEKLAHLLTTARH